MAELGLEPGCYDFKAFAHNVFGHGILLLARGLWLTPIPQYVPRAVGTGVLRLTLESGLYILKWAVVFAAA